MRKKTYAVRYIAGQPVERIFPSDALYQAEHALPAVPLLQQSDRLRVLVWNIFKQQRLNWLSVLQNFGKGSQLVLLQEAQSTPDLIRFATTHYVAADQVPAVVLPQHPSGVMTLSAVQPLYCCPLREKEPLLRLSKSALITVYHLQNEQQLMVINIHAINFSIGVEVYGKQLDAIGEQVKRHAGPVIMAGDFNAWSRQRINALYQFASVMALREVRFIDDQRRRTFGRPLDFVFYRGLTVYQSSVLVTQASDHNPLLVEFQLPN